MYYPDVLEEVVEVRVQQAAEAANIALWLLVWAGYIHWVCRIHQIQYMQDLADEEFAG